MRKLTLLCATLFKVALSISATPVLAQTMWVAANGSDSNACSTAAPCATLAGAYGKGSVSQINCLGSGHYGPITITTSLTLDCGAGNVGNISSSVANGITIQTTASATIILRHLALNGLSNIGGVEEIDAQSFAGGTLIVEDCMIHGYHGSFGIFLKRPTVAAYCKCQIPKSSTTLKEFWLPPRAVRLLR